MKYPTFFSKSGRFQQYGFVDAQVVVYVIGIIILIAVVSSCNRCVYRQNLSRQGYEVIEVEEGSDQDYSEY